MPSKMYILVKRDLPSHKPVAIAHGVLMCYLKFENDPEVRDWLKNSFRKVICEVSDEEFNQMKKMSDKYVIVTESGLGNIEVALVFAPRANYPEIFKTFPLMK